MTTVRLPDFLIIGAMKAGTTTLYQDLKRQKAVFLPNRKEPMNLVDSNVLSKRGRAAYARLFQEARPEQLCGEASTHYTQRPAYEGMAERAHELLGDQIKLIFLARNPIDRAISHHHHQYLRREADSDVNQYLLQNDYPVRVSQYSMQLEPWVTTFGLESILLIPFEHFVADRQGTLQQVGQFLGIEVDPQMVDSKRTSNVSATKRQIPAWIRFAGQTSFTASLRKVLPKPLYTRLRNMISYTLPPPRKATFTTAELLREQLEPDQHRLEQMFGLEEPLWDLGATVEKFRDS